LKVRTAFIHFLVIHVEGGVIIAIGICFSMTDVYRSEILAVVMQQIVDKPVLPVLFLRTVSHVSGV
jgi:hypothetical protein